VTVPATPLKDEEIIVVLGGSSGIGYEVARQKLAQGARVIVAGRDEIKLAAAAESLGGGIETVVLDAHDDAALERFFAGLDRVDHLVSMIGDSMAGGFLATSSETMRSVLHSKFWANWMIGKLASAKVRDGGSITFTSGTGGRAQDVSATYVANLGVGAMVQGLASELAPRVRVNAVAPTFMDTPFRKHIPRDEFASAKAAFAQGVPLQRLGTVEEVASAYVFLMTNGFITGQVLAVDGGVMLRK
jgi:NAD(P)-dependent dehydrogenase (short-subunit alcohol dehydrogenase family)